MTFLLIMNVEILISLSTMYDLAFYEFAPKNGNLFIPGIFPKGFYTLELIKNQGSI